MFNIQGSELIFLLLIALVVLGPEKLPEAMKKFGRAYSEFKKLSNGFQGEFRSVLEEPMRELRDTAEAMRQAVNFDDTTAPAAAPNATATTSASAPAEPASTSSLNFGSMQRATETESTASTSTDSVTPTSNDSATGGLNFGRLQRDEGTSQ